MGSDKGFFSRLRSVDPEVNQDFLKPVLPEGYIREKPESIRLPRDRESINKAVKEIVETNLEENDPHTVQTPGHRLLDRIERLERKIDQIFGDHVLINGRWIKKSNLTIKTDGED